MPQNNFTIPTLYGRQQQAKRIAGQAVPAITEMAFGDGDRVPGGGEAALLNEVHREPLVDWGVYPDQTAAWFDSYLAAQIGGFVIREHGLYDAAGGLVAIGRRDPAFPKVDPATGASDDFTYRIDVFFEQLDTLVVEISPIAGLTADNISQHLPWATQPEADDAAIEDRIIDPMRLWGVLDGFTQIIPEAGITLYVRSDGNDANDGSLNDAANAFQTLDGAIAYSQKYGGAGKAIELVLGMPGDYQAPELPPGSRFKIRSTGAAADHVLTNAAGPRAVLSSSQTFLELADVALRNTQPGFNTLRADTGASIILTGTVTIASPINPGLACIAATNGGTVRGIGVLTISQSAGSALSAAGGSFLFDNTSQINFPGGPTYGDAIAVAVDGGAIVLGPGAVRTGAALGKRYRVDTNGVINTSGGGVNFFPGDVAGTVANGGVYV